MATREAYGLALKRLGAVNPHLVAISGDVKNSTFSEVDAYPDHFHQAYIAEQNLVSAGVGLAARGKVPFLDTFACFFARAYDQVRMAAISRSNIHTAESRSARMDLHRWHWRILRYSARFILRRCSTRAMRYRRSVLWRRWRSGLESITCAHHGQVADVFALPFADASGAQR